MLHIDILSGHTYVAVNDGGNELFSNVRRDDCTGAAIRFLRDAVAHYVRLGITIRRLRTDPRGTFLAPSFAEECIRLGIDHQPTRPYRPDVKSALERQLHMTKSRHSDRQWT